MDPEWLAPGVSELALGRVVELGRKREEVLKNEIQRVRGGSKKPPPTSALAAVVVLGTLTINITIAVAIAVKRFIVEPNASLPSTFPQ